LGGKEMIMAGDIPLLTLGHIQTWKRRRTELEAQIAAASEELTTIVRKLAAASEFMEPSKGTETLPLQPVSKASTSGPKPKESLADAIMRISGLHPDGALPAEIKGSLRASGYDMSQIDAHPQYFYTVLNRLRKRAKLERRRNGSYRPAPKPASPQGETGAVAAPASGSTH
jgi:hypothetical protein